MRARTGRVSYKVGCNRVTGSTFSKKCNIRRKWGSVSDHIVKMDGMEKTQYKLILCEHGKLSQVIQDGASALALRHEFEERPTGWRASGLSSCLRRRGYELLGAAPGRQVYNFDYDLAAAQGTVIHERLQDSLVESGLVYCYPGFGPAVELPLSACCPGEDRELLESLQFSGHIDAVLERNDQLIVLDIKTVASKYLAGDGWGNDYQWLAPKLQGYVTQLHAYMRFCGAPDGRLARQGFVLMLSRDDTSVRRLYSVSWQEEVWERDLARLVRAVDAVGKGELPEAERERGPCVFCPYREECDA